MPKDPKQTVRWPPTGRLLEVAAADVAQFLGDGWEHLDTNLAPDREPTGESTMERPPGNGSRDAWAAYVESLDGDPGDLGRDELIEYADDLEAGDG